MKENRSIIIFCYYCCIEWMKIHKSTNVWKKIKALSFLYNLEQNRISISSQSHSFHSDLMKLRSHFISQNESSVSSHFNLMLISILSHLTSHSSVSSHFSFMSSWSHFISSHKNLISFHLISQKSDSVWFHFTKFLISSHLISQRFHLILISSQNEMRSEQNILILAVSLISNLSSTLLT